MGSTQQTSNVCWIFCQSEKKVYFRQFLSCFYVYFSVLRVNIGVFESFSSIWGTFTAQKRYGGVRNVYPKIDDSFWFYNSINFIVFSILKKPWWKLWESTSFHQDRFLIQVLIISKFKIQIKSFWFFYERSIGLVLFFSSELTFSDHIEFVSWVWDSNFK